MAVAVDERGVRGDGGRSRGGSEELNQGTK